MIQFLFLRYSFSRTAHHRARALRIVIATALSLAVLMVTMSVMEYLQDGRFARIRDVSSFDIVLSGDHTGEMRERFPDAAVFSYGESEALGNGSAYKVRFIGRDYDGGLSVGIGKEGGLLVPYTLYGRTSGYMTLTMMGEGRSGRMLPRTVTFPVSGAFFTDLGTSFDSTMLFLPDTMMVEGTPVFTAIKGVDAAVLGELEDEGYSGVSWKEQEAGLYSAFTAENVMMYMVLSLLFVVILVSAKGSARVFFAAREKERAELLILGLGRRRTNAVFLLAFCTVMLVGILLGLIVSHIALPAGERFLFSFVGVDAALSVPYPSFFIFSLLLLAFTVLFALREEAALGRRELSEVMADDSIA